MGFVSNRYRIVIPEDITIPRKEEGSEDEDSLMMSHLIGFVEVSRKKTWSG